MAISSSFKVEHLLSRAKLQTLFVEYVYNVFQSGLFDSNMLVQPKQYERANSASQ